MQRDDKTDGPRPADGREDWSVERGQFVRNLGFAAFPVYHGQLDLLARLIPQAKPDPERPTGDIRALAVHCGDDVMGS